MLNKIQKYLATILVFLSLTSLLILGYLESSINPSTDNSRYKSEQRADVEIDSRSPDERIADYTLWLERFTAALAAVSCLQIWLLFRADKTSRIIAESGLIQARAAVNVERPFVYISDLELVELPPPPPQADGIERGDTYQVVFVFTNYGRTPAFVTHIGCGFKVMKTPPEIPKYGGVDGLTVEIVIKPDQSYRFEVPYVLMAVTPEEKKAISNHEAFPWLWGRIQFRDFLNGIGETGFIAFQYPEVRVGGNLLMPASFRFKGPSAYTYQRYEPNSSSQSEV